MRVVVADDHREVRSALRLALEHQTGFEVVAEAASANDLLVTLPTTAPDLLLLDWELPGVRTVHLVPVLRSLAPGLIVVALSGRPETREYALAAGADAFVSKGEDPGVLLATLRGLDHGRA